jgi:hypothetical protein
VPGGAFTADPQSLANYDLGAHKWLPVPHAWVSPDGTKYAWPEYRTASGPVTGIIHVTDVATGTDHSITVPAPSIVVSWETAGIYISRVVPNSDAPPQGLSLVDPASEALHQITPDGAWRAIGDSWAYGADLDATIAPPPGSGPGASNRLRKVRLDTGAITTAGSYPGVQIQVLGAQGADVLMVLTSATRSQVMLGSSQIYDQPASSPAPTGPAQWDGTTVWLSGMNAVWRSVAGAPLEKIASPLSFTQVGGACR